MESTKEQAMVKLRKQGIGMISVLTLEYILGMTTNFFVQFPENISEGAAWKFAWTQVPLALHIIIGLLMFLGSLVLLLRSIMNKNKIWIIASGIAFVGIAGSFVGGAMFITKQTDTYSFIMAISFIVSFIAYFYGVYASKP